MNAKSRIKVIHKDKAIEMNTVFTKMIENPFSEEYAFLQKIRQDYPTYQVKTRKISKNKDKETYAGLTYQYMRDYIILHTLPEDELAAIDEFEELLLISKCHSKSHRYPTIKKWFLAKYPEIAEFGMSSVHKKAAEAQSDNVVSLPQKSEEKKDA